MRRALPLLLALAACRDPAGEDLRAVPASLAGFCGAAAPAWCAWLAACRPWEVPGTEAECLAREGAACAADLGRLAEAYRRGRVGWSGSQARLCLGVLAAPRCGTLPVPECRGLLPGAVEQRGACEAIVTAPGVGGAPLFLDECRQGVCPAGACGARCPAGAPAGSACRRETLCVAGRCAPAPECEPGLFCDLGICSVRRGALLPCVPGQGACRAGYTCTPDGHGEYRCQPDEASDLPGLGEACGPPPGPFGQPPDTCGEGVCLDGACRDATGLLGQQCLVRLATEPPCAGGLACLTEAAGASIGTCGPPRAAGEPCRDGAECLPGLLCRADGSCGAPAGEGAPCAVDAAGRSDCGAGLACAGGTCAARPGAGEECSAERACLGEALACDPAAATCAPLPPPGEPCLLGRCAPGAVCAGGSCAEPRIAGAACQEDAECASRACLGEAGCAPICP